MGDIVEAVLSARRAVIDEYDEPTNPREINRGYCTYVASRVQKRVDGAERRVAKQAFRGRRYREYPAHTWVYYDGMHYDAERPHGTEYWQNLPLFRRGVPIAAEDVTDAYWNKGFDERL